MLKYCRVIIHIENFLVSRLSSLFAFTYIVIFYETTKPHNRVAISEKKTIPRDTEHTELLIHSEGIPPVSKTLGIPFLAIPRSSDPFRGK